MGWRELLACIFAVAVLLHSLGNILYWLGLIP